MTSIDFRAIMYDDLHDPAFRREFIQAYYEMDGAAGICQALQCIAESDSYAKTGVLRPAEPQGVTPAIRPVRRKRTRGEVGALRRGLRAHGLDFTLTPSGAAH